MHKKPQSDNYDLIVIGSGPAGEKAAVKAAYFGYKVAIIEKNKEKRHGGAGILTGTLPSKTLKETSLYFSGKYGKKLYDRTGSFLLPKANIEDFHRRKNYMINYESLEMKNNLNHHSVIIYYGCGKFVDEHTIEVVDENGEKTKIQGKNIIIATGSYPFHPPHIPFDNDRVHDSDSILNLKHFPRSICVLGAGVIGCEYSTIFSNMGAQVYLVNHSDKILGFLDNDIGNALVEQMTNSGIEILFNCSVEKFNTPKNENDPIIIELNNGTKLSVDIFLFAAGRNGNNRALNVENIGLELGKRDLIAVNEFYQTKIPHIYAVGDAIGFPSLASTSMDQGRVAVAHIFGTKDIEHIAQVFPYGIYTIPEVSMVGLTEQDCVKQEIDYFVGYAYYKDLPRGKILGEKDGLLKLIFKKENQQILGAHLIGILATELIHVGLMLIENKKNIKYVIGTVFNFPTLHDLYKYACYDGLGNLSGHKIKKGKYDFKSHTIELETK